MDRAPFPREATVLVALYSEAERRLKKELTQAMARGRRQSAQEKRARILRINRIIRELEIASHGLAPIVIRKTYLAVLVWLDKLLGRRGPGDLELAGIHANAVAVLAQELDGRLTGAIRTVGRQAQDVYRKIGLEESAISVVKGEGVDLRSRAIQKQLLHQGVTGFVDRSGRHWALNHYARMVARTTTSEARSVAVVNQMFEQGIDLVTVSKHEHPHDICNRFEGRTFSVSGTSPGVPRLTAESAPPYHPNSVIASTRFRSIGGVRNTVRSRWNGPLIHLTTDSGISLSVGPNHPVPTGRGWLAAKFLREDDYVLRSLEREGVRSSGGPSSLLETLGWPHHDFDQMPTMVDDVFDALHAIGDTATTPASPIYFHGDGNFCEGEIDVVWADGFLPNVGIAEPREPTGEAILVFAGSEDESFSGVGSEAEGFEGVSFGAIGRALTDFDVELLESSQQSRPIERSPFSEILSRLSGVVATDKIVEVSDVMHWSGPVYDFETTSGMYLANQMLISNCTHFIGPAQPEIERMREQPAAGVRSK